MAKRHESLILLARDHHEALILALRLQQGTRALLRLWSHDPRRQAEHITAFYDEHLKLHFEKEETVLFPVARASIPSTQSIIDDLIKEHRLMEHSISGFRSPVMGSLGSELQSFGQLLEHHVRTEDRTLFPLIESQAPQMVLDDIQTQLEHFQSKDH
jgi:hemerythrin-like domain-containing protein